jgi:putative DNA primase/helicase
MDNSYNLSGIKPENPDFFTYEFLNSKKIDTPSTNNLLNHALHYARLGYAVLPLQNIVENDGIKRCSCRRWKHCETIGKHPRTRFGLKEATIDGTIIKNWWDKSPNANVGILTGKRSGIFVVDIDVKHGGEYSLDALIEFYSYGLKENYESLEGTLTTITGTGGRHLYFKYPQNLIIKSSIGSIGAGLDVRSDNAYVVAPPSTHFCGRKYKWFGTSIPIKNAPNWLLYQMLKPQEIFLNEEAVSSKFNLKARLTTGKILEGNRQNKLFEYICWCLYGNSKEDVLQKALEFNNERLEPPFTEGHVLYQVNYLYNKFAKAKVSSKRAFT